jgi:HAE1 family hydrophobic/amphiphilic exporter-1
MPACGGLPLGQLLTLFATPVVYLALDGMFHRNRDTANSMASPAIAEKSL